MGNKNNRGQQKLAPMSVKIAEQQLAQKGQLSDKMEAAGQKWFAQKEAERKRWTEKRAEWKNRQLEKKQAEENKLADKKAIEDDARKIAATMHFDCIQKHYALVLKENGEKKQLVITLNFIADPPTDMLALMKVLPEYSPAITHVQIKLLAPVQHGSRQNYHQRVQNMNKLMNHLNFFNLTELEVLIDIDSEDSFPQLKLAAAVYGLNFQDWTMAYQVMGGIHHYPIDRYSSYGKRLRGVHRAEFAGQ
ncbi:uncharacterized protein EAE97_005798 [Botrytis byssoidea]|uniref:Uncharacterized protein n=1 Tax=Botrytis byssoidea TaxID=139641 RepID=A0A9P5IM88_9HELO|nr:uncharacterized protein EAE97_005798 [Botrytis byssoidea]KAF7943728.1 hypothetical protein EAE97_005798 [Botrytis byssoidea]